MYIFRIGNDNRKTLEVNNPFLKKSREVKTGISKFTTHLVVN